MSSQIYKLRKQKTEKAAIDFDLLKMRENIEKYTIHFWRKFEQKFEKRLVTSA